jgi:hypothetical protein
MARLRVPSEEHNWDTECKFTIFYFAITSVNLLGNIVERESTQSVAKDASVIGGMIEHIIGSQPDTILPFPS